MDHWIPETLFSDIVAKMPVCTVDLALFNNDGAEVLVFRRSDPPLKGQWFTLGGRLRKNETLRDCAVRQAKAEADLTVDPNALFFGGAFDEIHDESRFGRNITYHCVNICWGYILSGSPPIQLDGQHHEYAWRPINDRDFHPMLSRKLHALQQCLPRTSR